MHFAITVVWPEKHFRSVMLVFRKQPSQRIVWWAKMFPDGWRVRLPLKYWTLGFDIIGFYKNSIPNFLDSPSKCQVPSAPFETTVVWPKNISALWWCFLENNYLRRVSLTSEMFLDGWHVRLPLKYWTLGFKYCRLCLTKADPYCHSKPCSHHSA